MILSPSESEGLRFLLNIWIWASAVEGPDPLARVALIEYTDDPGELRKMPAQLVGLIWGARPTSRPTSRGLPRLNSSHLQARGFCVDPQLGPGPLWGEKCIFFVLSVNFCF